MSFPLGWNKAMDNLITECNNALPKFKISAQGIK